MKTQFYITFLVCMLLLMQNIAFSQDNPEKEIDHSYKPLKVNLNEDGSKYIRFIMWHQIWATSNNLSDDNSNFQASASLRRSRFLAFAQISPKFLILTHWGLNSLSPTNLSSLGNNSNAAQLFLHGAWGELKLTDQIYAGAGLHYWKGLTRLSSQSTLNFMTLDQSRPFIAWHSLGITDQFARHLGIYLKGDVEKFHYRISVNNPGNSPLGAGKDYSSLFNEEGILQSELSYTGASRVNSDDNATGNTIIEGYFKYDLWDKEGHKLPYFVGTYMGKKKVLSIGAGFFAHPNGMYNDSIGDHGNVTHLAADVFMEYPTTNGALHAYATFINFNYGENYISRWGGTGSSIYGQLGYFLKSAKIMPYFAYSHNSFQGASDPVTAMDVGLNYYINGHHAKLTAEYHRITKDYREGAISFTGPDNLSQFRLQLHIFL